MSSPLLKQAIALHRAGKLVAAEEIYRRILTGEPGNSDALHFLGLIAHQLGRNEEAVDRIRKAIALRPSALYWYNLGHVHLARKDSTAAEVAFARTVELAPTHAEALFQLGLLRLAGDDLGDAEECFRSAIAAKPDLVEACINLALLLQRAGDCEGAIAQLDEARRVRADSPEVHNALGIVNSTAAPAQSEVSFRRALALKPDYAEARINLAKSLYQASRHAEAAELLEEMSRQRPDDGDIHMLLGSAYAEMNELDAAVRHFDAAAAALPGSPKPLVSLGHLYIRFGRFDEAYAAYQRTRTADPTNCDAAAAMLTHLKSRVSSHEAEQMGCLLQDRMLSAGQRRQLHFALAAYLDAAGDYDRAFHHMDEGNRLRRQELEARSGAFDVAAHKDRIDSIIEYFDETYFRRVAGFGVDSELPVFIVGMPRSGTTLCEQILASHSQVFGAGELNDISRIVRALRDQGGASWNGRDFARYAQWLDADTIGKTARQQLRRLEALAPKAARVVDKMPMNYQHLGLVATLFPGAKIFHCRRDPMDIGLSCYSKDFAASLPWACDLDAIALVYRQYDRLMAHWRRALPIQVLEVPYEDVVAHIDNSARRLITHCGLAWEDDCLAFHRTERQVKTASLEQVRQPLYNSSVRRWHKYSRHLRPLHSKLTEP